MTTLVVGHRLDIRTFYDAEGHDLKDEITWAGGQMAIVEAVVHDPEGEFDPVAVAFGKRANL